MEYYLPFFVVGPLASTMTGSGVGLGVATTPLDVGAELGARLLLPDTTTGLDMLISI